MSIQDTPDQKILLVTGPAGAGRLTALRFLEDLGYETIDNLPLHLLPRLVNGPALLRPMALGIDARNRDFSPAHVLALYRDLKTRPGLDVQLLFLECSISVLLRRYSETRRRHPLAETEGPIEGIHRDKDLMEPIRDQADVLIDTSALTVHDLRAEIDSLFAPRGGRFLAVQVQSFSYKRGLPRGLDIVFDVRFLRNPHWEEALRPMDGRDAAVAKYVSQDALYEPFFTKVLDLLTMLLPAYKSEGKSHLSIGFGCSGGRHRSVALAEAITGALIEEKWNVAVRHREMDRVGRATSEVKQA